MAATKAPQRRSDFKVAVLCALSLEAEAVQYMFERCWEDEDTFYGKAEGDQNVYTTGVISGHNVVLVHMPRMGNTNAALSAAGLRSSYPGIKLALVVGICGVVPFNTTTGEEIILGDIIVSTAVTQYDYGRQYPEGFKRKTEIDDTLGRVDLEIRSLLSMLHTRPSRRRCSANLSRLVHSPEFLQQNSAAKYPGERKDRLFEAAYPHRHRTDAFCEACSRRNETCPRTCDKLGCEEFALVYRERLDSQACGKQGAGHTHTPSIHFGRFGSANTVLKSGLDRDRIANSEKLIAFEMEGAGVWEQHPTIIIKAACDYADSHKSKSWQKHAAAMAAAFLKVFLDEWTISRQIVSQDLSNPVFHMPFDPIPGFVGRSDELSRVKKKIFDTEGRRVVSILGLGGIGKTRLTQELVYQIRAEQPQHSFFWVQANDELTFDKDILDIGEKLGISGGKDKASDIKTLVKQRLSNSKDNKWVLVLDNADDENLWCKHSSTRQSTNSLVDYLPKTTYGSIIVTTRSRKVANFLAGKEVVVLSEPSMDQAITMFRNALDNPHLADSQKDTIALLDHLAYLPLAITQASSFVNRTQEPVSTYLKLLSQTDDEKIELLSEGFEESTGHQSGQYLHPVATTWLVSFNRIRDNYPLAAKYLAFMACLLEKNIPVSLLPAGTPKETTDALAVLVGYSFIKRQGGTGRSSTQEPLFDMHRLVHLATTNWLSTQRRLKETITQCIQRANEVFPYDPDWSDRDKWLMYLPHGHHLCLGQTGQKLHAIPERYDLLEKIGKCTSMEGNYYAAVDILKIVVTWRVEIQGASHLVTLRCFIEYGKALRRSGDWATSERYLRQGVDGFVEKLGAAHPETLLIQHELALLYLVQGRLDSAQRLFSHVVEMRTKVLGPDHLNTIASRAELAAVYFRLGHYEQAESLLIPTLAAQKRLLGLEHPDTIASMSDMVNIHIVQGRTHEAETLLAQVLEYTKRSLHADHPDALTTLSRMAYLYYKQGRMEEAVEVGAKVFKAQKKVLGDSHPNTLLSMHNLACGLKSLGRDKEAINMMGLCVESRSEALGPDHPDTIWSRENLFEWQDARRKRERECRNAASEDRARRLPRSLDTQVKSELQEQRRSHKMGGEPSSTTRHPPIRSVDQYGP